MDIQLSVDKIWKNKTYMIAAVLGMAAISGILIVTQWDIITKSRGFLNNIEISNPLEMFEQISAQPLEIRKYNPLDDGLPKFSIDEYLGYAVIKP